MTAPGTPPPIDGQLDAALRALLATATLHLGDALPNGTRLAAPEPDEAWRALLCAVALIDTLAPTLPAGGRTAHEAPLEALLARFAEVHGPRELPRREPLTTSILPGVY